MEKRNVLGFFDGRRVKVLPPHPKGHGVRMPEEYNSCAGFDFLASRARVLFIFSGNQMISFDVSLEPDSPGLPANVGVGRGGIQNYAMLMNYKNIGHGSEEEVRLFHSSFEPLTCLSKRLVGFIATGGYLTIYVNGSPLLSYSSFVFFRSF